MENKKLQRQYSKTYGENFAVRLAEIAAEVEPIRKGNVARAENLFKLRLAHAMLVFRGKLEYDAGRALPWYVRFPDKSEFCPGTQSVLPILRRLADQTSATVKPHRSVRREQQVAHA